MSFSREGWKSQKILAQVCRQCLSKGRVTPVFMRRQSTTAAVRMEIKETPGLLEKFRQQLYPDNSNLPSYYSARVKKAMTRRQARQQLISIYQRGKKQNPLFLSQLSRQEFDLFLSRFISNPDDPTTNPPMLEALEILTDFKQSLPQLMKKDDYELMIYLATELKLTRRATELLKEATELFTLNAASYEAVIYLLSTQKKQQQTMYFWLKAFGSPTAPMVRSVILSTLSHKGTSTDNHIEEAAAYLRQYHPTDALADLVVKYTTDARELIDHALNLFAIQSIDQWRLNETLSIYTRKRQAGLSTGIIVKHLITKCLYTGQYHTAEKLLLETLTLEDGQNALFVGNKMMHWSILQDNIKQAVSIWHQLESNQLTVEAPILEELILAAAKLKYHVDTMRLYNRYCDLYPAQTRNPKMAVYVLRCMARSNEHRHVKLVQPHVESILDQLEPNLARIAVKSLFHIAANTGDVDLFERVFGQSEKMKLSLTHKGLTSLIACYLSRGDVQSAKLAFQKVAQHTDGPDVVDFNLLMRTVVMEDGSVDHEKIFAILKHMETVNVVPDETTLRTMTGFYKSDSEMQKNLYKKLLESPSSVSRSNQVYLNNIAIGSLLTRRDITHVVGILSRNNRSELFSTEKNKPILVNGDTYQMLMDAATKHCRYSSLAEKLMRDMHARGMKPVRKVYEALIARLAQKGKIAKARRYIELMESDTGEKADVTTYTKLVDGFLYLRQPLLAKRLITEEMVQKNIPQDAIVHAKLNKIEKLLLNPSQHSNKKN